MINQSEAEVSNILGMNDDIDGIGAWWKGLPSNQQKNVKTVMARSKEQGVRSSFAKDVLSRSNKLILVKASILKTDIREKLKAGDYTATDKTFFHRKSLGASVTGTVEIINPAIVETPGVCNFDKGTLPDGQVFALEGISVRFAVEASITDPSIANYSNNKTSLPASLKNAILEVKVGDEPAIEIPVTELSSTGDAITSNGVGYLDIRPMKNLRILQGGQKVTVNIKTGNASAAVTGLIFIEIGLQGTVLKTS